MCPSKHNDKTSHMQNANHHSCRDYNLAGLLAEIPLSQVEKPKKYQWAHVHWNLAPTRPIWWLKPHGQASNHHQKPDLRAPRWSWNWHDGQRISKQFPLVSWQNYINLSRPKFAKMLINKKTQKFCWSTKCEVDFLLINKNLNMANHQNVDQQNVDLDFCWSTKFQPRILLINKIQIFQSYLLPGGTAPPAVALANFLGAIWIHSL